MGFRSPRLWAPMASANRFWRSATARASSASLLISFLTTRTRRVVGAFGRSTGVGVAGAGLISPAVVRITCLVVFFGGCGSGLW